MFNSSKPSNSSPFHSEQKVKSLQWLRKFCAITLYHHYTLSSVTFPSTSSTGHFTFPQTCQIFSCLGAPTLADHSITDALFQISTLLR